MRKFPETAMAAIDTPSAPSAPDLQLDRLAPSDNTFRARPAGAYASFSRVGDLLYSSGVVGREQGQVIAGALQGEADVARGERAAMASVAAILRAAQAELGSLAPIDKVVTLTGYLHTAPSFTQHVRVMNAASSLLQQVFPDSPLPARTTVGVASLPAAGAVEVSMVIQLRTLA
jgi:enamine deaminase RidA (YjgF/YER057c/UK114 family)